MSRNPYSDTAADYFKAGWRGPLPLPYGQKEPPPTNFNRRNSTYPEVEQINEWCDGGPRNICVRCADVDNGYEVIGIDVDQYTKGNKQKTGFDQLEKLIEKLGPLPDTWTATARTDGKSGIRFFQVPAGLQINGKVDKDIETIRKGHRYAVVWPSVHPEGGEYWWYPPGADPTQDERTAWDGDIPDPNTFPGLPDEWVDFLTNGRTLVNDSEQTIDDESRVDEIYDWATETFHGDDDSEPCSKMREKLDKALAKLAHTSTFHNLLTNAHWNLLHLAFEGHHGWYKAVKEYEESYFHAIVDRGGGTTDRNVSGVLGEIFRSRIGALRKIKRRDSDPLTAMGTAPVLASCYRTEDCTMGEVVPLFNQPDDYEKEVEKQVRWLEVREEAKRRVSAGTHTPFSRAPKNLTKFLAEPSNPTPMRIDAVMPDGGRIIFSAPYKAGKTTAVGNLIRSLVDGDPFLDTFTVNKPAKRLVLIDNEMSQDMMQDELLRQGIKNPDAVVDVICLRGQVSTFDILNERCRNEWATYLRELGCDYLILDCLRPFLDALGLDENHEAGKFLDALDTLLLDAGINGNATIVHHMGHQGERARGDSRIQDWPDAIWKLVREKQDDDFSPRLFSATGRRDVEVSEGLLKYDPATRHLTYSDVNRATAKNQQTEIITVAEVSRLLTENQSNGGNGMSGNQIETEATKKVGVTKRSVRAVLQRGVETGQLATWDGPRNAKMFTIGAVITNDD